MNPQRKDSDRGQAWTFDALLMLALMVGGIIYATQLLPTHDNRAVAEDLVEAQLEQDVSDLLAVATATGDLRSATVYWDDTNGRWVDSGSAGVYTRAPPGHPLDIPLSSIFDTNAIGYNIEIVYQTVDGESDVHRMYYQGTPGAHGISVSSTIVLYDDTSLSSPSSQVPLVDTSNFYAPDVFQDSPKYNVIQVRIIAWKL